MNIYTIKKVETPITEESFRLAEVAYITYSPWSEFASPYQTEARLLYSDEALYVNLKTNEWPLTALHTQRNGDVCCDSCMEFFIAPDPADNRYLNFEINPIGTLCLGLGKDRYNREKPMCDEAIFDIKSVIKKGEWQLFYKVPFTFIKEYFKTIGNEMTGNLYKCGDDTPKEHYACWNPVSTAAPDFHRSEFFGKFVFEK